MYLRPEWHKIKIYGMKYPDDHIADILDQERKFNLQEEQLEAARKSSILERVYQHFEKEIETDREKILRAKFLQ